MSAARVLACLLVTAVVVRAFPAAVTPATPGAPLDPIGPVTNGNHPSSGHAVDNNAVDNKAVDDNAVDNNAVDDNAVDDNAVDDNAVDDNAVDNNAVDNSGSADNVPDSEAASDNSTGVTVQSVSSEDPNTIDFGFLGEKYTIDNASDPEAVRRLQYHSNWRIPSEADRKKYYATTEPYYYDWTTISYTRVTESTGQAIGRHITFKIIWGVVATTLAFIIGGVAKAKRDQKRRAREQAAQVRLGSGQSGPSQPSGGASGGRGGGPSGQQGTALAVQTNNKVHAVPVAA